MFRIGSHVSTAGGVEKAVDRQVEIKGNCGQLFVGSPRGWKVGEVKKEGADLFKKYCSEKDVGPWIVHGTYLINLATPKEELAEKSVATVQGELDASAELDIPYYTFHPGAHTGEGVEKGLKNIAMRLSQLEIPNSVTLLLENTAGKGTTLGETFAELQTMVEESTYGYDDIGVCLDTCHLFSAGYGFGTDEEISQMIDEIEGTIGIENVRYLHLNDSKHPFGSKKDEHEHIGDGEIGEGPFRTLINHKLFRGLPMVLETPIDEEKDHSWDIQKIRELRDDS